MLFLFALLCAYEIKWKDYASGMSEIRETKKPGIVLIYRPTCPACRMLNGIFEKSQSVKALAKNYVMIRSVDGSESFQGAIRGGTTMVTCLSTDGAYVPRLFFISPQGTPLMDVMAVDGNSRFKYYYFSEEQLIKKMEQVFSRYM